MTSIEVDVANWLIVSCFIFFYQADPFGGKLCLCLPSWGSPRASCRGLVGSSVPLGASWERLGDVFAASWGDLDASGRVFEPPGAVLGPLEAVFWGVHQQNPTLERFWDRFGKDLETQQGLQTGPKCNPKRITIEDNIQHNTKRLSRPSWNLLGLS